MRFSTWKLVWQRSLDGVDHTGLGFLLSSRAALSEFLILNYDYAGIGGKLEEMQYNHVCIVHVNLYRNIGPPHKTLSDLHCFKFCYFL